jgi:uncharacterized membrane protein HdeD (DUF308 family)
MEIILAIIGIVLIVVLLWEGKEYHAHQQVVKQFVEASAAFMLGFETVKGALNHNADVQKDVMEKVLALEKAMEIAFAVLEIHDKSLGLELAAKLRGITPFVEPKKLEG